MWSAPRKLDGQDQRPRLSPSPRLESEATSMKTHQFSEDQIIKLLHDAKKGEKPIEELCRDLGCSTASYSAWKKKYGDTGLAPKFGRFRVETRLRRRVQHGTSRLTQGTG
jgi:transposase-like protein